MTATVMKYYYYRIVPYRCTLPKTHAPHLQKWNHAQKQLFRLTEIALMVPPCRCVIGNDYVYLSCKLA